MSDPGIVATAPNARGPRWPLPIGVWIDPSGAVRERIEHDGGAWRWLLAAEVLVGPLTWALLLPHQLKRMPTVPEVVPGFAGFAGAMALVFLTLLAGLLAIRKFGQPPASARDLLVVVAWALTPIFLLLPLLLLPALPWRGVGLGLVLMLVSAIGPFATGFFTVVSAMIAVGEAGRWKHEPGAVLLILGWLGLHGLATFFVWTLWIVFGIAGGGIGAD